MQAIAATSQLERPITSYLLGPQLDPETKLNSNQAGPGGIIMKNTGCNCLRCARRYAFAAVVFMSENVLHDVHVSRARAAARARWGKHPTAHVWHCTARRSDYSCTYSVEVLNAHDSPTRKAMSITLMCRCALFARTRTRQCVTRGRMRSLFGTMSSLPIELLASDRTRRRALGKEAVSDNNKRELPTECNTG